MKCECPECESISEIGCLNKVPEHNEDTSPRLCDACLFGCMP